MLFMKGIGASIFGFPGFSLRHTHHAIRSSSKHGLQKASVIGTGQGPCASIPGCPQMRQADSICTRAPPDVSDGTNYVLHLVQSGYRLCDQNCCSIDMAPIILKLHQHSSSSSQSHNPLLRMDVQRFCFNGCTRGKLLSKPISVHPQLPYVGMH